MTAKLMALRRPDRCAVCGTSLAAGIEAYWLKDRRAVICSGCHLASEPIGAEPGGTSAADVAGASAQREYDRRAARELARRQEEVADDARWRASIKAAHPVRGRITAAFTPKPEVGPPSHTTAAWQTGAEGERRVAEVLTGVSGIEVLHDRLVPGRRSANIDHLVVGPAGVFVVDAKKYSGRLHLRDVGGFFHTDERLYVGGRDRTKTVEGVLQQVGAVRAALGAGFDDVPVHGVLCFIGCDWGLRMKAKELRGVRILWPLALPGLVAADGPHAARVQPAAVRLRDQLRPAPSS